MLHFLIVQLILDCLFDQLVIDRILDQLLLDLLVACLLLTTLPAFSLIQVGLVEVCDFLARLGRPVEEMLLPFALSSHELLKGLLRYVFILWLVTKGFLRFL